MMLPESCKSVSEVEFRMRILNLHSILKLTFVELSDLPNAIHLGVPGANAVGVVERRGCQKENCVYPNLAPKNLGLASSPAR
jgi:hypothetical protein